MVGTKYKDLLDSSLEYFLRAEDTSSLHDWENTDSETVPTQFHHPPRTASILATLASCVAAWRG